ncbi:MAG TPA: BrnT family toxin [Bosea sp. (in: a-proteobacteria)]
MALHIIVEIDFDSAKRDATLRERGLDFARAIEVFAGITFTQQDRRLDYGEDRFITIGILDERMVVMVWTHRGSARRIISMRKANEREQARYQRHLGRPR